MVFSLQKGPSENSTYCIFTTYYVPYVKCFTYFISFNRYNVVTDIIPRILQKKKQGYEEVRLKLQS